MAEAADHTPACSLTRDASKKKKILPVPNPNKPQVASWHRGVVCHLSAPQADLQQQHRARCRPLVRSLSSAKTELGDGKTELGALPLPRPGSDHSLPELPLCDSTYSGKDPDDRAGHQGLPVWSHRPPLPNPCASDHSRPPRFSPFLVVHGSPDLASWAGITAPPLHPSIAAPRKSPGPVPP